MSSKRQTLSQLTTGHTLQTECGSDPGPFDFIVACLNLNAGMASTRFTPVLGELLFQMKRYNVSVLALQETGLTKPDGLLLDHAGMTERLLIEPNGKQFRFRSLWCFPPGPGAVPQGSGTAIIWAAALPYQSPYCGASGRVSAVTLLGPTGCGVRIINVYGKSGPPPAMSNTSLAAKLERALRKCVLAEIRAQLDYARTREWTPIVLGDLNELADRAIDKLAPPSRLKKSEANLAHPPRPIIDLLDAYQLVDTFRSQHPTLKGFSFVGKGRTKLRQSRLDYIWCGARLTRSGRYRAGIDGAQKFYGLSDHLLCHAAFTFFAAFHASRARVLTNHDEALRTQYRYFMLEEATTRAEFRTALLGRVEKLVSEVAEWSNDADSLPDISACVASWTEMERAIVEESTRILRAHATTKRARGLGPFGLVQRVLGA